MRRKACAILFILLLALTSSLAGVRHQSKPASSETKHRVRIQDTVSISEDKLTTAFILVGHLNRQIAVPAGGAAVTVLDVVKKFDDWGEINELKRGSYKLKLPQEQFEQTELSFVSTLFHEYGHILFYENPDIKLKATEYFSRMSKEEREYFRDGDWSGDEGGAPNKGASEFFAGGFSVYCLSSERWLTRKVEPQGEAAEFWKWLHTLRPLTIKDCAYPAWENAPTKGACIAKPLSVFWVARQGSPTTGGRLSCDTASRQRRVFLLSFDSDVLSNCRASLSRS